MSMELYSGWFFMLIMVCRTGVVVVGISVSHLSRLVDGWIYLV